MFSLWSSLTSGSLKFTRAYSITSDRLNYFELSRSIDSKRHAFICLSIVRLSSGSLELAKLDSMSTFYIAMISSRLSRASRFLLISRNSFSDFVNLRAGGGALFFSVLIRLRFSIWLAKSIKVLWTWSAPVSISADSILNIEAVDYRLSNKSFISGEDFYTSLFLPGLAFEIFSFNPNNNVILSF